MDEIEDKNVFRILDGGKERNVTAIVPDSDSIPQNPYVITDVDGEEYYADGFLLFTSQHMAVMRDNAAGALPILVVPLHRVKSAELVEDDEELDLPF